MAWLGLFVNGGVGCFKEGGGGGVGMVGVVVSAGRVGWFVCVR